MNNILPSSENLKELENEIRSKEIVYISRFADIFNRHLEVILHTNNDSRVEWAILSLLIVRGGNLTHTQLAKEIFRSKHSITRFIDSLTQKGFVVRTQKEGDRRTVNIQITQSGLDNVRNKLPHLDKSWEPVLTQMSQEEKSTYIELTRKLNKAILQQITRVNGNLKINTEY
jgi:DNA-binding MarR family transcriptional regulator